MAKTDGEVGILYTYAVQFSKPHMWTSGKNVSWFSIGWPKPDISLRYGIPPPPLRTLMEKFSQISWRFGLYKRKAAMKNEHYHDFL